MIDPIRPARRGTLTIFVAAHAALTIIINLGLFASHALTPLASATGGLLTGSLLANWALLALLVGGVMLGYGHLRRYDLGIAAGKLRRAAGITLGIWLAAQGVHLLGGLLAHDDIRLHWWWQGGAIPLIGLLLTQLLGNALFEEIAFRGLLFPQMLLRLSRIATPRARIIVAIAISQGIFALIHIPNRLYLGMDAPAMLVDLVMLLLCGVLLTCIYIRTDNLFICVGIHALGNTPTTLFASHPALEGSGASLMMYAIGVCAVYIVPAAWQSIRPSRYIRAYTGA